jgi:hypothetical protein
MANLSKDEFALFSSDHDKLDPGKRKNNVFIRSYIRPKLPAGMSFHIELSCSDDGEPVVFEVQRNHIGPGRALLVPTARRRLSYSDS